MSDSSTPPGELNALRAELQRLQAELSALSAEQNWSRTLLETIPAIVMRLSLEGTIEYINRVLPQYAGTPLVGMSIEAFTPAEHREVVRSAIERTSQTLQPTAFESIALAPDGSRDWYLSTVGPVLRDGALIGLMMISANATRVREAEAALKESRAKLQLALDAGNVGVWRWDKESDAVEWDEKLTAMFGLPPGKGPRTVTEYIAIIPDDQQQAMGEHIERALVTGAYEDFELRLDRPEGTRWVIIKGGLLRGTDGHVTGLLGGVVDVTERRRVDEHLRQAQKLEAVGQLSAGVAHNFNNMLAVILPALELAKVSAPADVASLLDDAITSASNAAQLVRQLMVFARSQPDDSVRREPLSDVVRRAIELCRQTFERRVELELKDLDEARFVGVEPGAMEQAVMNLLLNARDAMPEGRPSRIEVSARRLDEGQLQRRHAEAKGEYVELRVTDTGTGMDATTRRRMLEPFFTTKATGRGTGLGLSTAWATVLAHRGYLDCESTPGEGTTFSLLFPAQHQPVQIGSAGAARLQAGGSRVVLLIDDEASVRRATAALLTAAGYEVLNATTGDEGVRLALDTPIDAVLLDYSMPGLSAQETMGGLRRAQPGLPVICLSGLAVTLEGATAHLIKPVTRAALVAALEAAMSSPRPG